MNTVIERAKDFLRSEDGPTATEYAVMLALMAAVVIGAATFLFKKVDTTFRGVADKIPN